MLVSFTDMISLWEATQLMPSLLFDLTKCLSSRGAGPRDGGGRCQGQFFKEFVTPQVVAARCTLRNILKRVTSRVPLPFSS